jgi:hypothetical protein
MCRVRWAALGSTALALLAAVPAHAADSAPTTPPPTYALSWVRAEGAEDCPTGRVLATEVERRLGRAVFDAAAERSFEVEVTRFGKTYRSDVYVRDAGGHTIGHRSLQSDEPGCSALVNATALAIALVIDPEAAAHEPPASKGVAAFEPSGVEVAPLAPSPAPAAVPAPAPAPPPVEMRLPLPARPTALTASARAQLTAGLVGATSPGFELSFSARPGRRWGLEVSGSYALAQTLTRGIGSLDLGLTRASALVTFDAGRSERVRLFVAAGPALGAFHVAVRRPAPVTSPGDFWFVAGQFEAALQVSVIDGIFIDLGADGFLPLGRQSFLVRGQSEAVFRQPVFSGLGFLGAGAMFP